MIFFKNPHSQPSLYYLKSTWNVEVYVINNGRGHNKSCKNFQPDPEWSNPWNKMGDIFGKQCGSVKFIHNKCARVNKWHNALAHCSVSPSTISSESSTKNSLSGGLFGLLSVFNSCWILVDTLLLTGTPGQTSRADTVTNICKQGAREACSPTHALLF